MKKAFLSALLLSLAFLSAKAQNCGSFPAATVCSQSPHGQQANCCRCLGTQPQNQTFCGGTPINKGLITLIVGGVILGLYSIKKQHSFDFSINI